MKIHRPYPHYPLPEDYPTLTLDGQRLARIATLKRQDTPQQLVEAWDLFCRVYLAQSKEAVFFKDGYEPSPEFHYDMVHDLGQYAMNVYAAPRGSAKCERQNTLLLTSSGVYKTIKSIQVGEKILSLNNNWKLEWKPVIAKVSSGVKPLLKITTKQGYYIECTPDHRLLINNEWVKAGEVKNGDLLATSRTSIEPDIENFNVSFSPTDAELMGILIGDGNLTNGMSFTLSERKKDILNIFDTVEQEHPSWRLKPLSGPWSFSFSHILGKNDEITPTSWLKKYRVYGLKSTQRRIPEIIWKSSNNHLALFLRGLFDTDGTVSKKNGCVDIVLSSLGLIQDIQLALLRLGIRSRYVYKQAKCNGKLFNSWALSINSAEARQKFINIIGSRIDNKTKQMNQNLGNLHDATDFIYFPKTEKDYLEISPWFLRTKYGIRIDNGYNITRKKLFHVGSICGNEKLIKRATSDIYWDVVTSIESIQPDETYDIQVEDNANFLANGIFSHNSTVIVGEIPPFLAITRPNYDLMLNFSTDRQKTPRMDMIMNQIQNNELIQGDFGNLVPKRGKGVWNHDLLNLLNGSTIASQSVMGKKRGGRPRLILLDDVENDPDSDSETSRLAVIEKFETILFKQLIPMLKKGSCIFWIGTLIDRKSFLYRAVQGDDERFDFWNRKILKAIAYDENDKSKYHLLWPEMWPKDFLDSRKEAIGASAFHSEYLNEPISAQDRILIVDPRKNEYILEGAFNKEHPLANTNIVKWNERIFGDDNDHRSYKEMTKPYNELIGPMFKILLFDYASGLTSYHDYSCIAVLGFDTSGTMWVLHLWLGRAKDDTLMRLIYEIGLIWQVRILGIEAVSIQKTFAEAFQEYLVEQGGQRGDAWRGRVFPITYPSKESKAQRIASLEWRFNSGRIKYPAHLQNEWPYNQLYAQTADFTMDLALLQHDDVIDTIGMSKHVIKTKGGQFKREQGKPGLRERILKRLPEVPGMPLLSGVSSNQITDEMCNIISQQKRKKNINLTRRRIERKKPRIIR